MFPPETEDLSRKVSLRDVCGKKTAE